MAVGFVPGGGGISYIPGPFGGPPPGVIGGPLGEALAKGGGGSSAPPPTFGPPTISEAEQKALLDKLMKEAQEKKKLEDEIKKAKEEKAFGGTISGQLQTEIGMGAVVTTTPKFKLVDGKLIELSGEQQTRQALTKNIGETQSQFEARARSLGKAIIAEQPEVLIGSSFGSIVDTTTQSSVGVWKPFTKEEIAEQKKLDVVYGKGWFERGVEKISSFIPQGKQPDISKEYFSPILAPSFDTSKSGLGGTMITRQKTDKELSEEAIVYGRLLQTDIGKGLKFETTLRGEREKIIEDISPGGITLEEAKLGAVKYQDIFKEKLKLYGEELKGKEKEIREQVYKEKRPIEFATKEKVQKILPAWEFDPYKFKEEQYEKGAPTSLLSPTVALGSFAAGFYGGVREKPLRIATSAGIAIGITAATAGLGSGIAATYGAGAIKTLGAGSKVLLAGYGVSVGGRILGTAGFYEKFKVAGGITSTEILPFAFGAKIGRGLSKYTPRVKEKIPLEFAKEKAAYEKAFKILKKEPVNVQNIRWSRVQEVPTKAGPIIEKFMIKRNLITGGTTAIETAGINLRRLPRDVEAYGSFKKISKMKLYQELGVDLKKGGVTDFEISKQGIIFGGKGHGFNLQDIKLLNIERYRYKIYTAPSGVKVADPLSTAYNKVADLLKSAKLGTPKAAAIAQKLEKPELISKATAGGRIYERYPKDVIGALSTARDITSKSLLRYTDFSKRQIPLYQEYRTLRVGQAKELIKPYLGKLKYEEAPAIINYYQGKPAGFFSGSKYIKSYTLDLQKRILLDKKAVATIGGLNQPKTSSTYEFLKFPKAKVFPTFVYPMGYQKQTYNLYKPQRIVSQIYPSIYKPIIKPSPISSPYRSYKSQYYPSIIPPPTGIFPPGKPRKPTRPKQPLGEILPRFPGTKKSKRLPQIFLQPTKYQPSFTASALNIKASKKPLYGGALTIRPVIPLNNVI